jgi:hypothetical protein
MTDPVNVLREAPTTRRASASSIPRACVSRALWTGVSALLIALGVMTPGSFARTAPTLTVLDQTSPVNAAAFGDTLAWLRAVEVRNEEVRRTALVVRDGPGAAPRVLIGRLPKDTQSLALGSDKLGQTTIVLACPRGLFTVATGGPARLRRVPGTRPDDATPALRNGVLSFSRARKTRGRRHITVRIGSLTSGRSRQIWSVPSADTSLGDTALGADHTVLFETTRFGHANAWTSALRIMRPGTRSRILLVSSRAATTPGSDARPSAPTESGRA